MGWTRASGSQQGRRPKADVIELVPKPELDQARQEIDRVLSGKRKYKTVADMIDAIYQQHRDGG